MIETINNRLKAARMAAGYAKAVHAAQKFGWNISTFRAHENGQNSFDFATAKAYADAFNVSPTWLLSGAGDSPSLRRAQKHSNVFSEPLNNEGAEMTPNAPVFISGILGEGYWVSDEVKHKNDQSTSLFPPDPRFPASRQFDLRLLGNSALPYAREGEIIRCVSIEKPDVEIKINDILVIETIKNGLKERKLRILSGASGSPILINFDTPSNIEPFFLGKSIMGDAISLVGKALFKYEFVESFVGKRPVADF